MKVFVVVFDSLLGAYETRKEARQALWDTDSDMYERDGACREKDAEGEVGRNQYDEHIFEVEVGAELQDNEGD